MAVDRLDAHCPRCKRITNQTLKYEYDRMGEDGNSIYKAIQTCGKCSLQKEGVIVWSVWLEEICNMIAWEPSDEDE